MGDIYSFMHKSTSYQCFCMTDQTCPPLYFVTQYVAVWAYNTHKLSPSHGLYSTDVWPGIISLTPLHHIVSFSFKIISSFLLTVYQLKPCKSTSNSLTHQYNRLALSSSFYCHSCLWKFLSQLSVVILKQWWKCARWQCMVLVWVELLRQTQINRRVWCEEA